MRKSIAVCLAWLFFWPTLLWVFETKAYALTASPLSGITFQGKPLTLPESLGTLQDSNLGSGPLIIHIQDLHCHYEVQKNIAGIVDHFVQTLSLNVVGEEGAAGTVNVSKFRTFPDADIRTQVADFFLRQGKLTGAEYFAATNRSQVDLVGIETPDLYARSEALVQGFLNQESLGYCFDLREALDRLKSKVYASPLRSWDALRTRYRQGKMEPLAYAGELAKAAARLRLPLEPFHNLVRYLQGPDAGSGRAVDHETLQKEMDDLERRVRDRLYTHEAERELDRWVGRLDVIEKLLNVAVTIEELEAFRQHRELYSVVAMEAYINQQAAEDDRALDPEVEALDALVQSADEFYCLAEARSKVFVDNLLDAMQHRGESQSVMITGGFHTRGVLAELERRGCTYVSLRPNLTRQDLLNPYFQLLQNRRTPLEVLLAKNQSLLALPTSLPSGTFARDQVVTSDQISNPRQKTFWAWADLMLKSAKLVRLKQGAGDLAHLLSGMQQFVQTFPGYEAKLGVRVDEELIRANAAWVRGATSAAPLLVIPTWLRDEQGRSVMAIANWGAAGLSPGIAAHALQQIELGRVHYVFATADRVPEMVSVLLQGLKPAFSLKTWIAAQLNRVKVRTRAIMIRGESGLRGRVATLRASWQDGTLGNAWPRWSGPFLMLILIGTGSLTPLEAWTSGLAAAWSLLYVRQWIQGSSRTGFKLTPAHVLGLAIAMLGLVWSWVPMSAPLQGLASLLTYAYATLVVQRTTLTWKEYVRGIVLRPWLEFRWAYFSNPAFFLSRHNNLQPDGSLDYAKLIPRILGVLSMYTGLVLLPIMLLSALPGVSMSWGAMVVAGAVGSLSLGILGFLGLHGLYNALMPWAQLNIGDEFPKEPAPKEYAPQEVPKSRENQISSERQLKIVERSALTTKQAFRNLTASQVQERLKAFPGADLETLFLYLDRKAAARGLTALTILERFLFVELFRTGTGPTVLGWVDRSRWLSAAGRSRMKHELEMWVVSPERKSQPTFSEVARIIYYETVESEDVPRFSTEEPLQGMPRLLLTTPYKSGEKKIGQFSVPTLGVHRIASFMKAFGYEVDVYDLDLYGEAGYYDRIKGGQYSMLGFSILEPTMKNQIRIMMETEKLAPNLFMFAGGQGAAFNAKFIIENTPVREVSRGVGEFSILDMAVAFENGTVPLEKIQAVKAVHYKDANGNAQQTSLLAAGLTQEDLRLVSMLWDPADAPYRDYWAYNESRYDDADMKLMNTGRQTKTARIYTESHCPLGCDFCSSTNMYTDSMEKGNQKLRLLEARDILRLIHRLKRAYPELEAVYFNDDDFFAREQRVRDVCERIIQEGLNKQLSFFALSRTDHVNPELLQTIRAAGFYMLIYGVESFTEHVLKDMEKKVRRIQGKSQSQVNREAIEDSLRSGLIPKVNLILFYPTVHLGDLKETIENTIDLMRIGAIVDAYTYVQPFAGSKIVNKGFEVEYDEVLFDTLTGPHTFAFPAQVLPADPIVKAVAAKVAKNKPKLLERIKNAYAWEREELPQPVDALATFQAVYEAAQEFDSSGLFNTDRIVNAIDELMRKAGRVFTTEEAEDEYLAILDMLPQPIGGLLVKIQNQYYDAIDQQPFSALMSGEPIMNAQTYFHLILNRIRDFGVVRRLYYCLMTDPRADYEYTFLMFAHDGQKDVFLNPRLRKSILYWIRTNVTPESMALLIRHSPLMQLFLQGLNEEEFKYISPVVAEGLTLSFHYTHGINFNEFNWIIGRKAQPWLGSFLDDLFDAHERYCNTHNVARDSMARLYTAWAGIIEDMDRQGNIPFPSRVVITTFLSGLPEGLDYQMDPRIQRKYLPQSGRGGTWPWMRALFTRLGMNPQVYDRWVAWILENAIALGAGSGLSMLAARVGGTVLNLGTGWGYVLAWPIFFALHFIPVRGERAPPASVWVPALIISVLNMSLALTGWPWLGMVLGSLAIHAGVNGVAQRWGLNRPRAGAVRAPSEEERTYTVDDPVAVWEANTYVLKRNAWLDRLPILRQAWLAGLGLAASALNLMGRTVAFDLGSDLRINQNPTIRELMRAHFPESDATVIRFAPEQIELRRLTPGVGLIPYIRGLILGHYAPGKRDFQGQRRPVIYVPSMVLKPLLESRPQDNHGYDSPVQRLRRQAALQRLGHILEYQSQTYYAETRSEAWSETFGINVFSGLQHTTDLNERLGGNLSPADFFQAMSGTLNLTQDALGLLFEQYLREAQLALKRPEAGMQTDVLQALTRLRRQGARSGTQTLVHALQQIPEQSVVRQALQEGGRVADRKTRELLLNNTVEAFVRSETERGVPLSPLDLQRMPMRKPSVATLNLLVLPTTAQTMHVQLTDVLKQLNALPAGTASGLIKRMEALLAVLDQTRQVLVPGSALSIYGEEAAVTAGEVERMLSQPTFKPWHVGSEFKHEVYSVATPLWFQEKIQGATFARRQLVDVTAPETRPEAVLPFLDGRAQSPQIRVQAFAGEWERVTDRVPRRALHAWETLLLRGSQVLPRVWTQAIHAWMQRAQPLGYLEWVLNRLGPDVRQSFLAQELQREGSPIRQAYLKASLTATRDSRRFVQNQLEFTLTLIRALKENAGEDTIADLRNVAFFSDVHANMPSMITVALAQADRLAPADVRPRLTKTVMVPLLLFGRGRSGALGALVDVLAPMPYRLEEDQVQRFRRKGFRYSFKSAA